MIIDLHVHTSVGSDDSVIEPEEVIEIARSKRLDGVCITEHGNQRAEWVEELARKHKFPVLGGMEASTELGDILIFGLESYPRRIHRAAELRQFVVKHGGVMVAAHPFRYDLSHKPWLKEPPRLDVEEACQREIFRLVDAMEIVNGWATEGDVEFALAVSARLGIRGTGGSDAHVAKEIGYCVTVFEDGIESEDDLVSALRSGRFEARDLRPQQHKKPTHLD